MFRVFFFAVVCFVFVFRFKSLKAILSPLFVYFWKEALLQSPTIIAKPFIVAYGGHHRDLLMVNGHRNYKSPVWPL